MNIFFQRCLELAKAAGTKVGMNPQVGAVVVHQGKIIGEGYHKEFGGPHAEVNAIDSVIDKDLLKESEIYVSLEPCCHFGKTPPCTNLIIESGIKKVYVGMVDPNPMVAGKGIEILRDAGIEVEVLSLLPAHTPLSPKGDPRASERLALGQNDFTEFYRSFIVNQNQKRAYIVLKWAETSDGFIAGLDENGNVKRIKITNEEADTEVHRLRTENQGILIGKNTALIDNPQLNVRLVEGDDPVRILLDRKLDVPRHYNIFSGRGKVIVLNETKNHTRGHCIWAIPPAWDVKSLLEFLYNEMKIASVLVEGGKNVLEQFILADLYDEIWVFKGNKTTERGIKAPEIPIHLKENFEKFQFGIFIKREV